MPFLHLGSWNLHCNWFSNRSCCELQDVFLSGKIMHMVSWIFYGFEEHLNSSQRDPLLIFLLQIPIVDSNSTVAAESALPPLVHVHSGGHNHGRSHHKLTALHDPHMSGLLSAESESAETVPVAPAVKVDAAVADPSLAPPTSSSSASDDSASVEVPLSVVKRAAQPPAAAAAQTDPVAVVPPCPGRIRFF